ncbi:hypothetical protein KKH35_01165 [Patescibacteria group bacterium]|nr:hypothetical protein [Patescibacteria group bacterium]
MKCENCGEDSDLFVILSVKKPNGSLSEIVCHSCALLSPAYCKKHQMPHLGFADDEATACRLCIEEAVIQNKSMAEEIYSMLISGLLFDEIENLDDWAEDSSIVTGDSMSICVLRAVITRALRLNISIEEIVKRVIEAKSTDLILPNLF